MREKKKMGENLRIWMKKEETKKTVKHIEKETRLLKRKKHLNDFKEELIAWKMKHMKDLGKETRLLKEKKHLNDFKEKLIVWKTEEKVHMKDMDKEMRQVKKK
uniref:Uncharacterized protein n=1 Tax=Cacopsylla melanoneura TaxID=428564 RepID=A0A8D9ASL9_9HEMI